MVESLQQFLLNEYKSADEAMTAIIAKADDQLEERNARKRRARSVAHKRSRRRDESRGIYVVPESAAAYKALVRSTICQHLLKPENLSRIEAGSGQSLINQLRGTRYDFASARQQRKIDVYYDAYLEKISAMLSREHVGEDQHGVAEKTKGWNAEELYARLRLRAKGARAALPTLSSRQFHDPIAAAIYLREHARLAALDRFCSSGHLQSWEVFRWRASIIKNDLPTELKRDHEEFGAAAWERAIKDLEKDLLNCVGDADA
jgi:hypothetical protein